jgi:hypothetical protein
LRRLQEVRRSAERNDRSPHYRNKFKSFSGSAFHNSNFGGKTFTSRKVQTKSVGNHNMTNPGNSHQPRIPNTQQTERVKMTLITVVTFKYHLASLKGREQPGHVNDSWAL